jgi:hypothetical protein
MTPAKSIAQVYPRLMNQQILLNAFQRMVRKREVDRTVCAGDHQLGGIAPASQRRKLDRQSRSFRLDKCRLSSYSTRIDAVSLWEVPGER